MPMTPFIGVRISWLMLARNSLLARLACSARAVASGERRGAIAHALVGFGQRRRQLRVGGLAVGERLPQLGVALVQPRHHRLHVGLERAHFGGRRAIGDERRRQRAIGRHRAGGVDQLLERSA